MDICFKSFQGEVTGRLVEAATEPDRRGLDGQAFMAGDCSGLIYWYLIARWPLVRQDRVTGK